MDIAHTHAGLRQAAIQFSLVLIFLLALSAGIARAEDRDPIDAGTEPDQYDMYYDAMLRSIELDKSRWKSFSRSMESGPWFYDTQGLKRTGTNVSTLVTVFPHPNKTGLYSQVYSEHTKIRKIVFLTEINCSKQTYRQPEINVYGYYRELLAEHSSVVNKRKFSPIQPGTTTDTLRTLVCGPDKKKRN
jgi:hypothetical protein